MHHASMIYGLYISLLQSQLFLSKRQTTLNKSSQNNLAVNTRWKYQQVKSYDYDMQDTRGQEPDAFSAFCKNPSSHFI